MQTYSCKCYKLLMHFNIFYDINRKDRLISDLYFQKTIMTTQIQFDSNTMRVILAEILESLTTCENALNLEDAKSKAGNDMLKVMQYVYPIVVSTQMDVIKKYGLPEGREGIIKFTRSVVAFEKDDRVVADLHRQIRSFYLPPVNVSSAVTSHV